MTVQRAQWLITQKQAVHLARNLDAVLRGKEPILYNLNTRGTGILLFLLHPFFPPSPSHPPPLQTSFISFALLSPSSSSLTKPCLPPFPPLPPSFPISHRFHSAVPHPTKANPSTPPTEVMAVTLGRSKGTGHIGGWKVPSLMVYYAKGRTFATEKMHGLIYGLDA